MFYVSIMFQKNLQVYPYSSILTIFTFNYSEQVVRFFIFYVSIIFKKDLQVCPYSIILLTILSGS